MAAPGVASLLVMGIIEKNETLKSETMGYPRKKEKIDQQKINNLLMERDQLSQRKERRRKSSSGQSLPFLFFCDQRPFPILGLALKLFSPPHGAHWLVTEFPSGGEASLLRNDDEA
jgi:hypothetical protein